MRFDWDAPRLAQCPNAVTGDAAKRCDGQRAVMIRQGKRLSEAVRLFLKRCDSKQWPEKTWEEVIAFGRAVLEGEGK